MVPMSTSSHEETRRAVPWQLSLARLVGIVTWIAITLAAAPLLWNQIVQAVQVGTDPFEFEISPRHLYSLPLVLVWLGVLGVLITRSRGIRWIIAVGIAVAGCATVCLLLFQVLWVLFAFG